MRKNILRSALFTALLATIFTSLPSVPTAAAALAQQAPGELDMTFPGFATYGIRRELRVKNVNSVVLQPDGKIVTTGHTETTDELAVFRYLPTGKPDVTFGNTGKASFPGLFSGAKVALQNDGKIVVGGTRNNDFHAARLTPTGALDTSFDFDGWFADIDNQLASLSDIIVQSDGNIVACGDAKVGGDADFGIARYTTNGWRDTSFSGDGKLTIPFGGEDICESVVQQPDGKLVVAGGRFSTSILGDDDFALARILSNGALDNTFDGDGKLTTGFGDDEAATDVILLPDGRIVALGTPPIGTNRSFLARYQPSGKLDSTFDNDGKLSISSDRLTALALQPDGRLLALGYRGYGYDYLGIDADFALVRLMPSGTFDISFDYDGAALYKFAKYDMAADLAVQADGRILIAGLAGSEGLLARLWQDGTNFDAGGQQVHGLQPGRNELTSALAVQSDGKLLVAGEAPNASGSVSAAFVSRFLADGQIDSSFGYVGTAQVFGGTLSAAHAIAVQSDGKIVIAGYATGPGSTGGSVTDDFLVARFHANGTADSTFGTKGIYRLDFAGAAERINGLAVTPDGKIVVAGSVMYNGRQIWGIARLTSSGALDPSFSYSAGPGKVLLDFGPNSAANAVVLQPDGKVLLGGKTGAEDFVVARLLADGPLDTAFGPNRAGYIITNMGGADAVVALGLAPNGWIYAAGFSWRGGTMEDFALAQYQPNGTLPQCPSGQTCKHWPGGVRFINMGGSDSAYALVMRGDNQLVAAGCSDGQMAAAEVSTTDISAPLLFKTDFAGEFECANGVQFSDVTKSKIVLAGWQIYNNDYNIGLARFQTTSQTLASSAPSSSEPNAAPEVSAEQPPTDGTAKDAPVEDVGTPTTTPDDTQNEAPADDVSTPTDAADDVQKEVPVDNASTNPHNNQR